MNKLSLIIRREYTTRVRKKAFIIMTLIGPLLFAALMFVPVWLSTLDDNEDKTIVVVEIDHDGRLVPDSLMRLSAHLKNKPQLKFEYPGNISISQAEELIKQEAYYGALIIKHRVITSDQNVSVELLSQKQPGLGVELHITNSIENFLHDHKLLAYDVPIHVLRSSKTKVNLVTRRYGKDGFINQGNQNIKRGISYAGGFLIYMFIFFFGTQVMRGVVEEKSNRIIEVIITSVKPFQLMMGKIIGIGLVGLTQFMAWILLTFAIITGVEGFLLNEKLNDLQTEQESVDLFESSATYGQIPTNNPMMQNSDFSGVFESLDDVNFPLVIGMFFFYFIGGYLLYASLFAAIGAAADSETDTQQFMIPVTIPLIISIIVMMNAITNPEGQLAFWFSIIPFTSPIVMMARSGFEPPLFDLLLSGSLLILTFIFMTWLSGKIYRTGILMYGKKVSFKEIFKWLKYK